MRAPCQERFASSSEIPQGLLANLVARRCRVLQSPEEIELIYWLQYYSHQEGGLKKIAKDLTDKFRDRVATRSMLALGVKQFYSLIEAQRIRNDADFTDRLNSSVFFNIENISGDILKPSRDLAGPRKSSEAFPANLFKEECESYASRLLGSYLEELCLNPEIRMDRGPWYFPGLIESLFEYQKELAATEKEGFVETELAKLVHETLDYSLHGKCLTLIDGRARTGKTFAAKKWIAPGKARFVEIPPGNSDTGFFRAIGAALGLGLKLDHTLRDRIESVLRTKNLMLVFDEAQFAWPDTANREALPFRVSWIMAMVNAGVPISLIVTNQFFHSQRRTERRSGWTSEQFVGRIAFYQPLPESLSDADLANVSKALLPKADASCVKILVLNAKASEKYLAGIEFTVKRARYLANKAGREQVLISDLKRAITEGVIPSDKALAQVMATPEKLSGRRNRALVPLPEIVPGVSRQRTSKVEPPQRATALEILNQL